MRTGIRFEGKVGQTCEGTKRLLQKRYQCQSTLGGVGWLLGMQILELWQGGHLLVDLGIILHGTRTQGIETRINAKIIV